MRISVIIPVFNEKSHLAEIIDAVEMVPLKKQIIVVDDYSSDGAREILRYRKGIKVILHEKNMGKGAAIRSGLIQVNGDYVIIQDADLEYTPAEYIKLITPVIEGRARVVYGSRILGKGEFLKASYLANRVLTLLTNLLFHSRLTDMETCYKLLPAGLMRSLQLVSSRFEIETEITGKLLRSGERIMEIPIRYQARKRGKKIGVKDGIQAIWNLMRWKYFK
ncbi:MAG: glycosyltransferase family 2 protein [candidate division WOR-3 bacterium]